MTIPTAAPAAITPTPLALLNITDINEMLHLMTVTAPPTADAIPSASDLRAVVNQVNAAAEEVFQATAAVQSLSFSSLSGQPAMVSQREWMRKQAKTILSTYKTVEPPAVSLLHRRRNSLSTTPTKLRTQPTHQPNATIQHTHFPNRVKFSDAAVAMLREWISTHPQDQYPDLVEKERLAKLTNMTYDQVSNWFINYRSRNAPKKGKRSTARWMQRVDSQAKKRRKLVQSEQQARRLLMSSGSEADDHVKVEQQAEAVADTSPITPLVRPRGSVFSDVATRGCDVSHSVAVTRKVGTSTQLLDSIDKIILESSYAYLTLQTFPQLEAPELSLPATVAVVEHRSVSVMQVHHRTSLVLAGFVQDDAASGCMAAPILRLPYKSSAVSASMTLTSSVDQQGMSRILDVPLLDTRVHDSPSGVHEQHVKTKQALLNSVEGWVTNAMNSPPLTSRRMSAHGGAIIGEWLN